MPLARGSDAALADLISAGDDVVGLDGAGPTAHARVDVLSGLRAGQGAPLWRESACAVQESALDELARPERVGCPPVPQGEPEGEEGARAHGAAPPLVGDPPLGEDRGGDETGIPTELTAYAPVG